MLKYNSVINNIYALTRNVYNIDEQCDLHVNFFFVAFLFVCRVDWFLFVVVCFVLLLGVFCFLFCFFPGWEIREGQYWKQGKFGTDHDILAKMQWVMLWIMHNNE